MRRSLAVAPEPSLLPAHLSVSQVTTYLTCPRRYRFRYLDQREPETKAVALALGGAVHSAIEWWFSKRRDGNQPSTEEAQRIFRADWTAQVVDPLLDFEGQAPEDIRTLGESLVRLFVERFVGEPVPDEVEARFEVPLVDPRTGETLDIPLLGYQDYLTGRVVGEIKTCARRTLPSEWALQLAAYSYAFRETYGHKPAVQVVELIKTKEPKLEVLEATVSEQDECWFLEVAAEVVSAIRAGAYFPSPGWQCARCEFRRACRG